MHASLMIEISALLLTLGTFVWAAGRLKGTLDALVKAVDGLTSRLDTLEDSHHETRERLAAVEAKRQ